jgi:hypothetical protein
MWIPSHLGVMGNERVDCLTGEAARGLLISGLLISDLCQGRECWTVDSVAGAEMPWVDIPIRLCLRSHWYLGLDTSRCVVNTMNRMMSNHSCLRSHLGRIDIVENLLCVCLRDNETIDHVMLSCERYDSERRQLWNDLRFTGTAAWGTPVMDLQGCRNWRGLRKYCSFLQRCNLKI